MAYIFDLALLVISGCSAVYCWSLSRRLRALQNLKSGMGQAMVGLTKSVTAVEANAQKLHRDATEAVTELKDRLAEVDAYEARIDVLLETMDRQAREAWKDYKRRTEVAAQRAEVAATDLTEVLADAKSLTVLMNRQILALSQMRGEKDAAGSSPSPMVPMAEEEPASATVVPLPTAPPRATAEARQPFARGASESAPPAEDAAAGQASEARRLNDREMMLKALRAAKASAAERRLQDLARKEPAAEKPPARVSEAVRRFGQAGTANPFLEKKKGSAR